MERTRRYLSDPRHAQHLRSILEDTSHNLQRFVGSLEVGAGRGQSLRSPWKSLGKSYESLLVHIRNSDVAVPNHVYLGHIKPTNYARNLFHVLNGVI